MISHVMFKFPGIDSGTSGAAHDQRTSVINSNVTMTANYGLSKLWFVLVPVQHDRERILLDPSFDQTAVSNQRNIDPCFCLTGIV